MSKRKLIIDSFPDTARALRVMQNNAPQFMRCPNGHPLPHRIVSGRCTPVDCADTGGPGQRRKNRDSEDATAPLAAEMALLPRGEEAAALAAHGTLEEAEEHKAYSEETLVMLRLQGIDRARQAFYKMPEIPRAEQRPGESTSDYLKRRADEAAKYALELKIWNLQYGTQERRDAVAEELLNYNGLNRKQELPSNSPPPVMIIMQSNPYQKAVVHEQGREEAVIEEGAREGGSSADGGGVPRNLQAGDDSQGFGSESGTSAEPGDRGGSRDAGSGGTPPFRTAGTRGLAEFVQRAAARPQLAGGQGASGDAVLGKSAEGR